MWSVEWSLFGRYGIDDVVHDVVDKLFMNSCTLSLPPMQCAFVLNPLVTELFCLVFSVVASLE